MAIATTKTIYLLVLYDFLSFPSCQRITNDRTKILLVLFRHNLRSIAVDSYQAMSNILECHAITPLTGMILQHRRVGDSDFQPTLVFLNLHRYEPAFW